MGESDALTFNSSLGAALALSEAYDHLHSLARELGALDPFDVIAFRALLRGLPSEARLPDDVSVIRAGGCPVEATWIVPPRADSTRCVVYCHGLGFMAGDLPIYGSMLSLLARTAGCPVLFVDYRLAPEHLYPAAHEDCLQAFLWACENSPSGPRAMHCSLIGDSCGASLALAAALDAARLGVRATAVGLLAPFVDLTVSGRSTQRNAGRDPFVTEAAARACALTYAPGQDPATPRLSPLFADLSGLPPLHIQTSSSDPLLDDALRLTQRALGADVPVELHMWTNVPHGWYFFHDRLADARNGIALAAGFVR